MTAEEFSVRYDSGGYELVNGLVEELPMPGAEHGAISFHAGWLIANFVKLHKLGWILSNDTFVLTKRKPDSVRGADICYVSYSKIPPGQIPVGSITIPPELVIEVLSPSDSITEANKKQAEYINLGVVVGILLNPRNDTATIFRSAGDPQELQSSETMTIPDVLPGFSVQVSEFFAF